MLGDIEDAQSKVCTLFAPPPCARMEQKRVRPEEKDTPPNESYDIDLNNNRRTLSAIRLLLFYVYIELI